MNKYYLNAIYPIFYLALLDIDVFLFYIIFILFLVFVLIFAIPGRLYF